MRVAICLVAACAPAPARPHPVSEIDAFNLALHDATLHMDNAAVLALWEDDGVSLLPNAKPLAGKQAIGDFVANVMRAMPEAHMTSFEMTCSGIEIAGDNATEYCFEHQVVDLGAGKQPFDGAGTMLLVLHRGGDGKWRLRREMWNQGVKP
jgi:ketosteroid isomerase-like protein